LGVCVDRLCVCVGTRARHVAFDFAGCVVTHCPFPLLIVRVGMVLFTVTFRLPGYVVAVLPYIRLRCSRLRCVAFVDPFRIRVHAAALRYRFGAAHVLISFTGYIWLLRFTLYDFTVLRVAPAPHTLPIAFYRTFTLRWNLPHTAVARSVDAIYVCVALPLFVVPRVHCRCVYCLFVVGYSLPLPFTCVFACCYRYVALRSRVTCVTAFCTFVALHVGNFVPHCRCHGTRLYVWVSLGILSLGGCYVAATLPHCHCTIAVPDQFVYLLLLYLLICGDIYVDYTVTIPGLRYLHTLLPIVDVTMPFATVALPLPFTPG